MKYSDQEGKHHKIDNGLYVPQAEKDACGVGFIADMSAKQSHRTISSALTLLENMEHRGACGCEKNTGDGAGILTQIPYYFFSEMARQARVTLPEPANYGVAMVFFPKDNDRRAKCEQLISTISMDRQFDILMYRPVPVDNSMIGDIAKSTEPEIVQIFFKSTNKYLYADLEKQCFYLKNAILKAIYDYDESLSNDFYISSLSSKTIVYKGLLTARQLRLYYPDLQDSRFKSALAIVHSRFSTNTAPKWKLAQPFRCIAHNGEINTIRGNINWWRAREKYMTTSHIYKDEWLEALPVCDPYLSDSGNFDNVVDFLIRTTRSIPHALMMMIPEAWQNNHSMPLHKRAFYEYHDAILEPWDGPAAICFTDGNLIGATLDRNGLRPARYAVCKDGILVLASEAGSLGIPEENIIRKGRLQPGKILVADLHENRIVSDKEVKKTICNRNPYMKWVQKHARHIDSFKKVDNPSTRLQIPLATRQIAFGFSREDVDIVLAAMVKNAKEAVGSMGADIPLAILSKMYQHVANYFKQDFAQVTNPPIDSLRESFYMSLSSTLGGSSKILKVSELEAITIRLDRPLLNSKQFGSLLNLSDRNFQTKRISTGYPKGTSMHQAIEKVCLEAERIVRSGANILIVSDEEIDEHIITIPSLLVIGAVHHSLIEIGLRKEVSLIVAAGDAWETHHMACLLSYGADAIYPYLVYETIEKLAAQNRLSPIEARKNYTEAVDQGLLKIMSKLGISTLPSYKGAQTFEALGISTEVVNTCFKGTISRIEGMRFIDLQRESEAKHNLAFSKQMNSEIPNAGIFQWSKRGEYHIFNPTNIHLLQHSTKSGNYGLFKKYSTEINAAEKNYSTLRSLFQIKSAGTPILLDEVEPVERILRRFATGAMSFGSISHEAHSTLAIAMNRIGGKSNSGEGGEDERRFIKRPNGDWERSAIKQVASGRFGVTINYLVNGDEIQIKIAQGAKPGEGGQLPGHKVDKTIARVRHATPGVGLISPPPHHDIYSIEDLAQLIFDLKNANPEARISVKLVSKAGVGVIASGVAKAHADHILISGHDGGTGASPLSSILHAGLPWELGLSETHQTLIRNGLRDRVTIQCDGQIRTGRDLAIATMLGAEEWGIATAALVVEGCILMRKCHLNTCPVGIATQNPVLRKKFNGNVEALVNYFTFLAMELRELMAQLGVRTVEQLVGRTEFLTINKEGRHWKTENLNLSPILYQPDNPHSVNSYKSIEQDHGLDQVLDHSLIKLLDKYEATSGQIHSRFKIESTNRSTGTMLSGQIATRYGSNGLNDDSLCIDFEGSAGQSLGAFLIKGVKFCLEGEANDYVGKGLSGGKIVIRPSRKSIYNPSNNVIVGNVCFYAATSGQAYINGIAGDRFCVRNSGADIVVEGVGDNGCEYMTGGHVVILGQVGNNFGAGMSGGIAYLYKPTVRIKELVNMETVLLEKPNDEDLIHVKKLISEHFFHTQSALALDILHEWYDQSAHFLKIIPEEYKSAMIKTENNKEVKSIAS